jgi:hypothetical protein
MLRKLLAGLAVVGFMASAPAQAQIAAGYLDIGPTIGLGGIGDAGMSIGGRFEKIIKPLESLGGGLLGIQAGFQYYSYDFGFGSSYSVKYIPIGATANYHFKVANDKIDPFLGLGLGFEVVSCDYDGPGDCSFSSGIYFIGRAGIRYFFKENMSLYGDVGAGGAALNVGLMFKLK